MTCNDVDAMAAALPPARAAGVERLLARSVLDGVSRAAHVACISEATRTELLASGRVAPARTSVSYLGVHPSCRPGASAAATTTDLLHVGSTIPRKRIDVLLRVFAQARTRLPQLRLVRAGGALTAEQQALRGREFVHATWRRERAFAELMRVLADARRRGGTGAMHAGQAERALRPRD